MPHPVSRRTTLRLLALSLATAGAGSTVLAAGPAAPLLQGKVFISTNAPAGNELRVYQRASAGPASFVTGVATGGTGTGAGLGSQGAVTLSRDGRWLFVVNAGSNTVSTFSLRGSVPTLVSVVDSGGLTPTSVTESRGRVYVLNAGGEGGVRGFRNDRGTLVPLEGVASGLSGTATAPGQVGLSNTGDTLVVTERNTNLLSTWSVAADGTLGARATTASPGATPFGFAFTTAGVLVVSEAAAGGLNASSASSYRFAPRRDALARVVSAAVPTGQTAACWVAVTPDGRTAYAANAGSSSLSSYAIDGRGTLQLLQSQAGFNGVDAGALDTAVSPDGLQVHVFASRALQIVSYAVAPDGSLTPLGSVGGLPLGSAGLAVN